MTTSDREDIMLMVLHFIIFLIIKNRIVYIQNTHLYTQPRGKERIGQREQRKVQIIERGESRRMDIAISSQISAHSRIESRRTPGRLEGDTKRMVRSDKKIHLGISSSIEHGEKRYAL